MDARTWDDGTSRAGIRLTVTQAEEMVGVRQKTGKRIRTIGLEAQRIARDTLRQFPVERTNGQNTGLGGNTPPA